MSLVRFLLGGLRVGQLLLECDAPCGLLGKLLLQLHLALCRGGQFGRDALAAVLVRRLHVSESPFKRASGGGGL